MRINELLIPSKEALKYGFDNPIELNRLGCVVAFVGKNGSGKTRLINLIYNNAKQGTLNKSLSGSNPNMNIDNYLIYVNNIDKMVSDQELNNVVANICKQPLDVDDAMVEFIFDFIGKDLIGNRERLETRKMVVPNYGDRPFDFNELSPGEQKLFKWALFLFKMQEKNKIKISEAILFIDEPEQHLHPDAQIGLIDNIIRTIEKNGQLWIATHSIHILAYLGYDDIYMMQKNRIQSPSRTTPGNSFIELMGVKKRTSELNQFITSISEWACANFLAQCFLSPDTIATAKKDDPQIALFKESLTQNLQGSECISLLDFGAGKGRLANIIFEDNKFKNIIEYNALETNAQNRKFLKDNITLKMVYNDYTELNNVEFDYIIISNVLHEIHPEKWKDILNKLISCLKRKGFIIIIEDKLLPKGESPNNVGYLTLDTPELKILFRTEVIGTIEHNEKQFKDRILCAVLNKENLTESIRIDDVSNAIDLLSKNTLKEIKSLRKAIASVVEDKDMENRLGGEAYKLGRMYGHYSQLYINAIFAVESLGVRHNPTDLDVKNTNKKTKSKRDVKITDPLSQQYASKVSDTMKYLSDPLGQQYNAISKVSDAMKNLSDPLGQQYNAISKVSDAMKNLSEPLSKQYNAISKVSDTMKHLKEPLK